MKKSTDVGMNRIGIAMSPVQSTEMIRIARSVKVFEAGIDRPLATERAFYAGESNPLGTVPLPGTINRVRKWVGTHGRLEAGLEAEGAPA